MALRGFAWLSEKLPSSPQLVGKGGKMRKKTLNARDRFELLVGAKTDRAN